MRSNLTKSRQHDFERWFDTYLENAKKARYFQELRDTTVERVKRESNPQSLPDGTPVVQNIIHSLYPIETVYEFHRPSQIVPLWTDCGRERFADDGSLKAGVGYYSLWCRLRYPYSWNRVQFLSEDKGRIKSMLQKKGFDYRLALEDAMSNCEKKQVIVYGAPGTGKSFFFKNETSGEEVIRTTFHPDTDYATFVGAYKPTMTEGSESKIGYSFVAQSFLKAYIKAWSYKLEGSTTTGFKPVFLVVEEINRGNCAQIFGDLFQLLDRNSDGFSDYPVAPDTDLSKELKRSFEGKTFADVNERNRIDQMFDEETSVSSQIIDGSKLVLPDNLYIWATMNTSDQSLFPMDSAFKRRWDWKYVPISKPDEAGFKDRKIKVGDMLFDWWDFITIVNKHISDITKSEDKQLGYFFVKAPDETGYITAERFANKVLFYLYNDVFKDWDLPVKIFGKSGSASDKYAFRDFFYDKKVEDVDGTIHKPGDIRSDEIVKFIRGLAFGDQKVAESSVSSESSTTT